MIDYTPTMISCAQRGPTERVITLHELARVNIHPIVFESPCNPAGGPHNRAVAFRAIEFAYGTRNACLFFEDDILVNDMLFPKMLDMARVDDVPTTFTSFRQSVHPDECMTDFTPRLVKMVNTMEPRGFYGTQAFYIPYWLVKQIIHDQDEFITEDGGLLDDCDGFDFYIKHHVADIYMAFPNPVDHRQPPKMKHITRGQVGFQVGHRSLSYHLGFRKDIVEGK